MKNDLFEKAKQVIAEKHRFRNWKVVLRMAHEEVIDEYTSDAAELYGQWCANEAVKADRNDVLTESYYDRHHDHVAVRARDISDRPLPFPPKPDER